MKIAIFWFAMLQASVAFGMTGNELYSYITSTDTFKKSRAIVYIMGVVETESFHYLTIKDEYKDPELLKSFVCMPDGSTYGQAQDIAKQFLENSPQHRHLPASALVIVALREAWPCKD